MCVPALENVFIFAMGNNFYKFLGIKCVHGDGADFFAGDG